LAWVQKLAGWIRETCNLIFCLNAKTNSGAVRVVGDGIFSFIENKNMYKTMEELCFDHVLIDNLKNKECLAALST
jgi:hypothetical protein